MAHARLTNKQRRLVGEVKNLLASQMLDPDVIMAEADPEARTTYLELAKLHIIRGAVILKYVLMDELLSAVICWHYFGRRRSFQELWKTKRFRLFNYFILERLYLLQKLDLIRGVHKIPKWVSSDLAALNELRNGIAHSFFPENRRRGPEWKGHSVFADDGWERFLEDMQKLSGFFREHFWRGSREDIGYWLDVTPPEFDTDGE